jgi:hypothetical protein
MHSILLTRWDIISRHSLDGHLDCLLSEVCCGYFDFCGFIFAVAHASTGTLTEPIFLCELIYIYLEDKCPELLELRGPRHIRVFLLLAVALCVFCAWRLGLKRT